MESLTLAAASILSDESCLISSLCIHSTRGIHVWCRCLMVAVFGVACRLSASKNLGLNAPSNLTVPFSTRNGNPEIQSTRIS
jgi:hypothetical protein